MDKKKCYIIDVMNKKLFKFNYIGESDGYAMIHVHFDCPICEEKDVGTEYISEYYPNDKFYENQHFFCRNCGAEFVTRPNGMIEFLGNE